MKNSNGAKLPWALAAMSRHGALEAAPAHREGQRPASADGDRATGSARPSPLQSRPVAALNEEQRDLFATFGCGPVVEPRYRRLHQAFEAQVKIQPCAVAIDHAGQSLSYEELDRQANRLASLLIRHGVKPGDAVGLFLRRSISMVIGILATLKAGAAYVPQDPKVVPSHQLGQVIDQSCAKIVLTTADQAASIPKLDGLQTLAIDRDLAPASIDVTGLPCAESISPDDRCFILFTSGTTGRPNGVQVTHRNVANIILTSPGDLGIRPGLRVAQLLNIGFDMAAWEILGCLCNGGTLLIRGSDMTETASQADVIIATPSILGTIDAAQCRQATTVAVAGEPCPRPLADKWAAFCTFYNACGPTETTIVNTMQPHDPTNECLTIGRPTPNNTVYILGEDMKPVPFGEAGVMWAGGNCVTAGYIGNAELTAERYRPDPFLGEGRMMFNTRDLGRWTRDGELEHLGRVDDQVKIRGFRIELDSVSSVLEAVDSCDKAVTLKFDERHLVAFVSPGHVDGKTAYEAIANQLPYYCKPLMIIGMDDLPKTSRGKVDKRRLMEIAHKQQERQTSARQENVA